ncbi:MAG: HipA domain-containing protein [Saprospiraceae bacterium]|nr:HipA domain-containing protein [Saprospiraceae bacterium]
MSLPEIKYCPGTLAEGFNTYSRPCLNRVFNKRTVSHILPYYAPTADESTDELYLENQKRISISGIQVKYSVLLEKNKLRLTKEGERGTYILKPAFAGAKNFDQMPANEHLTMQIAQQVFNIDTASNAMIFFKNGAPGYITKRFDVKDDGTKWAKEDFASLAERSPQTHGENYKYVGNYLELFELMKIHLPAYITEAPKLYKLIGFNYLFSNGDAHYKNFSLIETPHGDFQLSPAYDLLNSRIHINDQDFALEDGLLPRNKAQGKIMKQFHALAEEAGMSEKQVNKIWDELLSGQNKIAGLIEASFLNHSIKRNYLQAYQTRYNKLTKE